MRSLAGIAVATTLTLIVSSVGAQTAQDLETARELFKEATELHDAHDAKGALPKFKAAHDLANTPVTGIELAKTYVELGLLTEAREVALGIERIPVKPNESEKTKKARTDAATLADALRARIASLTVVIDNAPADATAQVTLDGNTIPPATLAVARKVNPGAHVVVASISGAPATTVNVSLGEGEARTVHVTLQLPAPPPVTPPVTPPPPAIPPPVKPPPAAPPVVTPPAATPVAIAQPAGDSRLSRDLATWAGISAGFGIAGVVGGIAFGAATLAQKSKIDEHCNEFRQCDSTGLSAAKDAHESATGSTVCFVLGGAIGSVAVLLGVLAAVTAPGSKPESARLLIAPTAGGISIGTSGSF